MVDEISKWCAAYFDEGQAAWRLPARSLPPYAAWRSHVRHDRNPEAMGIRGFRAAVAGLPDEPRSAIAAVVERLGIPARAVEDYMHRALFDIGGWAGYARYLVWESELYGRTDDTLVELLAIRLSWGYALFLERRDAAFKNAWHEAMAAAAALPLDERLGDDPDLIVDLVMQHAYEAAHRRRLVERLAGHLREPKAPSDTAGRRPLQAAFCIDVRSEVYRRALETVRPEAETLGFAGFFGFPIEYVPIGRVRGGAPALPALGGELLHHRRGGEPVQDGGGAGGPRGAARRLRHARRPHRGHGRGAVQHFGHDQHPARGALRREIDL
jgi:hypothetical protein